MACEAVGTAARYVLIGQGLSKRDVLASARWRQGLRRVRRDPTPLDVLRGRQRRLYGCDNGMICVPNADYQGRECGKPPPAYP